MRRAWMLSIAVAIDQIAAAAYYASSRPYIADTFGEERYGTILLFAAAESLPGLAGPLLGLLGDFRGVRALLFLSMARALLLPLIPHLAMPLAVIVVGISGLLSVAFSAAAFGSLLREVKGSASSYAKLTVIFPLAWAAGGLSGGLLEIGISYAHLFAIAGGLHALSSAIALLVAEPFGRRGLELRERPALLSLFAIALSASGLSVFFSMISIKLYEELGSALAYGIVGVSLTSLASAVMRPFAGAFVERIGESRALRYSVAGYALYSVLMYIATGYLLAALWLFPLYPFREVSLTMYVSKRMPASAQSTAAGLISMIYSAASVANIVAYPLASTQGLKGGLVIVLLALTISYILLSVSEVREKHGQASPRFGHPPGL